MITCYYYLYKTGGIIQWQVKVKQIAIWPEKKKKVKTKPSQNQNCRHIKTSSDKAKVASLCAMVLQTQYKACSLLFAVAILHYWVIDLQ